MKQRFVAVLIARQGSSRLPGKALRTIMGRPLISLIWERLKRMELFDEICLATSHLPIDAPLLELARKEGITAYAGDPEDVLGRLTAAAEHCKADIVLEVGGDCPFLDRELVLQTLELFHAEKADYANNALAGHFPDGYDAHIVSMTALRKMESLALLSSQRHHCFSYFFSHPKEFKSVSLRNNENLSHLRWTVDYEEDFDFIANVFEALYPKNPLFGKNEILALLQERPELSKINAGRIIPHGKSEVPGNWFTTAYIQDTLHDIAKLAEFCRKLEDEKNYSRLQLHYDEMRGLVEDLQKRAKYFDENH